MIGKLDRRIVIERATVTRDGYGQQIETWSTHMTIWAGREDLSDGERVSNARINSSLASRFVVRYSAASSGILPTDRIHYDGARWNISGIKETKHGRGRYLEISAERALQ